MIGTLLAATGLKVAGHIAGGIGGSRTERYNAQAAEREAAYARQLAGVAREEAGVEVGRVRERGRAVIGAQRAAAAVSGVDVNVGSPLTVMLDTLRMSEQDAMLARYKGDVRAGQLEGEAETRDFEAKIRKRRSRQTLLAGLLEAGGDVLGGASTYYKLKP